MKKAVVIVLFLFMCFSPLQLCKADEIIISKTNATLEVNEKLQLFVNLPPDSVTWVSSNKAVAEVSDRGVVTAINVGLTVISVKFYGTKLKCFVTVIEKKNEIDRHLVIDKPIVVVPLINSVKIDIVDYLASETKISVIPLKPDIADYKIVNSTNGFTISFESKNSGNTHFYITAEFIDGTRESTIISVVLNNFLDDFILFPII